MPSVYRPKNENGYRAKIGYVTNQQGKRVRREFRLGDDALIANKRALLFAEMWLKEEQRHQRCTAEFGKVFPNDLPTLPIWTGLPETVAADREAYLATPPEDLPGDEIVSDVALSVTLERASTELLGRMLGKARRDARSLATYWWYEQQFRLGLVRPAIDPKMPVSGITLWHIEQFCEYWGDLQKRAFVTKLGSFGWQTAKNRINSFAFLLRDFKGRGHGFIYPERADAVFNEAKRTLAGDLTAIQTYCPKRIKAILERANDRLRLMVYLALNFGMYQSDIGQQLRRQHTLAHGGVIDIGDETYNQWNRHKLKRRQRLLFRDEDDKELPVLLTHYIWPETLALLKRYAAPDDNPYNLWLLNEDGKPLWRLDENQKRPLDSISTAYYRAARLAEVCQPFDQFRKFGATAAETLGSIEVQEMYRGERRKGSSRVYVLQDFVGKLTPFLKTWADRLRADGVLY